MLRAASPFLSGKTCFVHSYQWHIWPLDLSHLYEFLFYFSFFFMLLLCFTVQLGYECCAVWGTKFSGKLMIPVVWGES